MSWNYRVIKVPDKKLGDLPQSYSYGIYEVYYTKGKPTSWSAEPVAPCGESWNDLEKDYNMMFEAFKQKTLEVVGDKLVERKLFY